jgi:hypothetical protein
MTDHLLSAVAYAGRYGFAKARAETCATEIQQMVDYARTNPSDAEWAFAKIEAACARLAEVEAGSLAAVTTRSGDPRPLATWSDHDRNIPIDEQDEEEDHIGMRKDRT